MQVLQWERQCVRLRPSDHDTTLYDSISVGVALEGLAAYLKYKLFEESG